MKLVHSKYFPSEILIEYLPIDELIKCISVNDLLNNNNNKFEGIIDDINTLLKNPRSIKNGMNWKKEIVLDKWDGFRRLYDDRIKLLNFYNCNITNIVKNLFLPKYLDILNLSNVKIKLKNLVLPKSLTRFIYNNINLDDEIEDLKLPPNLIILDLTRCEISEKSIKKLKLPSKIKTFRIGYNNIGDGIIDLVLPFELKVLDINNNNITNKNLNKLKLPPKLIELFLYGNNLKIEDMKKIIMPPKIKLLDHNKTPKLLKFAKSRRGLKRYYRVYQFYNSIRCKLYAKEICRGLLFGKTDDPIFLFLQNIHGSRNIRENILTYYNPFLKK